MRPIRIIEALGLALFVSFMWHVSTKSEDKEWWEKFLEMFITIALFWFLGWIFSLFY